jgi:glycosyltransferase involved in cell wall biosynthesis
VGSAVAFVSFRFGTVDGVSVEAAKWEGAFADLGWTAYRVAGEGDADVVLPGLAMRTEEPPPATDELDDALAAADLVVVENVCSLPLNLDAASAVAAAVKGRPAVLHHHDLPWQRPRSAGTDGFPPDDPAWAHVTINQLSRRQLADRGIEATAIPNCFDTTATPGDRRRARRSLGVDPHERLLLHPTRAIPRKNVPAAIALAEALGAVYWLLGPAEDGYGPELDRLLARTSVRVVRGTPPGTTAADAYAAADAVTLPSTWEGFGNATVESAVHRRPLAVGAYPVAREIAAHGFRWFPADDPAPLAAWLDDPDATLLDVNAAIAARYFSLERLRTDLADLLECRGWA